MSEQKWENWLQNQQSTHCGLLEPSTEEEIVASVKKAKSEGKTIKISGSTHSFNRTAAPDGGYAMSLDNYKKTIKIEGLLATFEAGIRLKDMLDRLWKRGLTLENVPDILEQSLAGACATNSAGTGYYPGISTTIREIRLICGDGGIRTCSRDNDPDLFMAATVGVGVVGIVSQMTIECVPAFKRKRVVEKWHTQKIIPQLKNIFEEKKHVYIMMIHETPWDCEFNMEWYETCDLDDAVEPIGGAWSARAVKKDDILEPRNAVDRGYLIPSKPISTFGGIIAEPGWIAENFMDVKHCENFVNEWFEMQKTGKLAKYAPLVDTNFTEFRFATADDLWLSPMYGRDTFKYDLAIFSEAPGVAEAYKKAFTELSLKYEARMHWGKVGWHTRDQNRKLFPKFDDFLIQRRKVDPTGVFLNDFTRPVFGDKETSSL